MGQNLQTVLYAGLDVHAEQHELMLLDARSTKTMFHLWQLHHFQAVDWHFLSHLKYITHIQNVQEVPVAM
jgi:hypothetical protein